MEVREATLNDLDAMVQLAEQRRLSYESHQPVFWRRAEGSMAHQRSWFERLLQDDHVIALIGSEANRPSGLIVGRLMTVPPVYDPGGPTCMVDDFTVTEPALWPLLGKALLDGLRERLRVHPEIAQILVVAGHHDAAKKQLLESEGLSIASEWWTTPL
jgi:hypothetical protein